MELGEKETDSGLTAASVTVACVVPFELYTFSVEFCHAPRLQTIGPEKTGKMLY
jgi:hypothetical protein